VGVWVHGGKLIGVWLLSSFLLVGTRYTKYLMATLCMCFMSILTSQRGVLSFHRATSDCLCMAPRTPLVMIAMIRAVSIIS
jgi:hypothetical protein